MRHSRLVPVLIVFSCFPIISACGGGGGGGGSVAETSVPPPDNTTPNTAPVANDQSVSTDENAAVDITLTGSDADDDSVSFAVSSNPANGTLSGTAPDLTYTPDANFSGDDMFTFTANDGTDDSAEATISITVNPLYAIGGTTSGVVNTGLTLENNGADSLEVAGTTFEFPTQLADGSSYDVTVAALPEHQLCSVNNAGGTVATADVDDVDVLCRSWRTAASIEDDTGEAGSPQIAFDGDGNAMAVWIQDDGSYNRVWANTWSSASGWGTATQISGSTGDADKPQVVFDSDGNAIATWTQLSTYTNLWINHYEPGTGWGTAGFIEFNDGNAANPQIAADASGNAMIVWEQDEPPPTTPNPTNIWAITYSSGSGSWGTAEMIETTGGSAQMPQVAFDSNGNAVAVWHQYDGSTQYNIRANTWSSDSSNWGTAEDIESTDDGNSFNPQIVIDSTDKATVIWSSDDGTRDNIWTTTWSSGSGWGTDELIETDNAGDALNPQIAVDGDDNLIAVWRYHDGTRYSIQANTYSPGNGWATAGLVETDDGSAGEAQVAFDGEGNAIAVWRSYSIWANTWSPGAGWSTEQLIETDDAGSARAPQIGFDNAGNAIAVWTQGDGTRDNIEANVFE